MRWSLKLLKRFNTFAFDSTLAIQANQPHFQTRYLTALNRFLSWFVGKSNDSGSSVGGYCIACPSSFNILVWLAVGKELRTQVQCCCFNSRSAATTSCCTNRLCQCWSLYLNLRSTNSTTSSGWASLFQHTFESSQIILALTTQVRWWKYCRCDKGATINDWFRIELAYERARTISKIHATFANRQSGTRFYNGFQLPNWWNLIDHGIGIYVWTSQHTSMLG